MLNKMGMGAQPCNDAYLCVVGWVHSTSTCLNGGAQLHGRVALGQRIENSPSGYGKVGRGGARARVYA